MKKLLWSVEKNRKLRENALRRVTFEDIAAAVEAGGLLADVNHPNQITYPNQRMLVVLVSGYVYGVPYVETKEGLLLKTAFPSRRLKNAYLTGEPND